METILIFRIGSIGDTVVALPCFHLIARAFPDKRRIVIADIASASQKAAGVETVLGGSGLIDGVINFPPPTRRLRDFVRLAGEIRRSGADTMIYVADRDLLRTLRDVSFFRLCGIRKVIGAPLAHDLRRYRIDPVTGDAEMESKRLLRCLAELGTIDADDPSSWDLRLQPQEIHRAKQALAPLEGRPFLAINVGGKVARKDWGDDNWESLLRCLAGGYRYLGLVFIGSADEFNRHEKLRIAWPGASLNLCGRLAPRESAAAMREARLFIGHDSGPMHLAAAVGVPCVSMFGDFNVPRTWYPHGRGHRILHDMRGVRSISPLQVYDAVGGALDKQDRMSVARRAEQSA